MRNTIKQILAGAILALGVSAGTAQAALVLGSNVDDTVFTAAIGSTAGWSYLGQSTSAFSGGATGQIELRSAAAANSFGFSRTNHSGMTTVFASGDAVGSSEDIAGYSPSYLFYFRSIFGISFIDSNTQFTDGFDSGGLLQGQGGIEIFKNGSLWAFFFDDGGPSGLRDDNDYNDMVVTVSQATVPAPAALSLLGLGFLAAGMRRRKQTLA